MKHAQVRRARKLGEAVFRGAGGLYTFDVFPLTTDIRDSGAVFIISRRIMDRSRSGHHRTICIGESGSIVSEIKKHKRAKCAKTYEANAVCILRDEDRKARAQVIDDLVAARSFECIRNVAKPIAKPIKTKTKTKVSGTETTNVSMKSETPKTTTTKVTGRLRDPKESKARSAKAQRSAKKAKDIQVQKAKPAKQKKTGSNVVKIESRSKAKKRASSATRKKAA